MIKKLLNAGLWVFAGLMLGRVVGFARESLLAARLGVTSSADVAVVVLTVPDQILNLLVAGSMGAALIPEFNRLSSGDGRRLFVQASVVVGLAFVVMSVVFALWPSILVAIFAPGFTPEAKAASESLMQVVIWVLPLTALASVSTAYLQSHHRFAVAGMGTFIFNVALVGALFFFVRDGSQLYILALAVILGSLMRLASQYADAAAVGVDAGTGKGVALIDRRLVTGYLQAVVSGSLIIMLPIIARVFATFDGDGSLAAFNYAGKLVELPLGVFLSVFSVVLFPRLSDLFSREETGGQGDALAADGLRVILVVSVAMTLTLAWFSREAVWLAFGWGGMDDGSIGRIGVVAAIGMLSLPAQGLSSLAIVALYARKDMQLPFFVSVIAAVLYVPLAWAFQRAWGLPGVMASLVVVYWAVFIAFAAALRYRHGMDMKSVLFGADTLKALVVCLAAFAPIGAVTIFADVKGNIPASLALLAAGAAVPFAASMLAFRRYRGFIMERIRKRTVA